MATDTPKHRCTPHGVEDLATFLLGDWRLKRRLVSFGPAQSGEAEGRVVLVLDDAHLLYAEETLVRYAGHCGAATRRYRYRPVGRGVVDVLFEDGRFFHKLDLRRGRWHAEHLCGRDVYRGSFRVLDPDRWIMRWRVRGPNKNLLITTLLERGERCQIRGGMVPRGNE